jgi:hypothetical protein
MNPKLNNEIIRQRVREKLFSATPHIAPHVTAVKPK